MFSHLNSDLFSIYEASSTFSENVVVAASVTANYFVGDGSLLTNLPGGSGVTVYPATATASFPSGFLASTAVFSTVYVSSTFTVAGSTLILNGTTYYWPTSCSGTNKLFTINSGVITCTDAITDAAQQNEDNTFTGVNIFNDSLQLPTATAPILDVAGEVALDTSISGLPPHVAYATSTTSAVLYAIAVSSAELHTVANGEVVAYNSSAGEFRFTAAGAGDVILASTQTHSGAKTFGSSTTFNGYTEFNSVSTVTLSAGATIQFLGGFLDATGYGTNNQVWSSNGSGAAPTWKTVSGGSGGFWIGTATSPLNMDGYAIYNSTSIRAALFITTGTITAGTAAKQITTAAGNLDSQHLTVVDVSTGTNLAATAPVLLTGDTLSLQQISLSTGVTGMLADGSLSASVSLLGSQIDISGETNLAVTAPIILTDDTLSLQQVGLSTGVTGTLAAAQFPALTGAVTTSAGSLATSFNQQVSASTGLVNALAAANFPALTGDVTTVAGLLATTVADNSVDGTDIALGSDAQGDVMYYDGTNWVRLAKGTAGQVLEMNAGATAPEWDADDAGSGGASTLAVTTGTSSGFSSTASSPTAVVNFSSDSFKAELTGSATAFVSLKFQPHTFTPLQVTASSSTLGISNSTSTRAMLLFDGSSHEWAEWQSISLAPYQGGTLTADIAFTMASATSGGVTWAVQLECITSGDSADYDTASFDVYNSTSGASVPGTAGHLKIVPITLSNADSCAANDSLRVRLNRVPTDAGDTNATDAEFRWMRIHE
jgi:hypothetical protein